MIAKVITPELATSILAAEKACYSSSQGPDSDEWYTLVVLAEKVAGRTLSHCDHLEPSRERLLHGVWESGAERANAEDGNWVGRPEPHRSENFQLQCMAVERSPSMDALFKRLYAGDRLPEGVAPELPDCDYSSRPSDHVDESSEPKPEHRGGSPRLPGYFARNWFD